MGKMRNIVTTLEMNIQTNVKGNVSLIILFFSNHAQFNLTKKYFVSEKYFLIRKGFVGSMDAYIFSPKGLFKKSHFQ